MQQWFNNLKRQEQILLLVGAACVALYLIFVVVMAPMSSAVDKLEQQNRNASAKLASVKQLAAEYKALEASSSRTQSSGANLTRIVDNTVQSNNLSMSRFQPSSRGDVQIRFENAVFNNLLAWIHELETEHAVVVRDLTVSPGSGNGLVNVSVRLRQGA